MKIIKIDLPRELERVEIHTFADEHLGDEHCDLKRLVQRKLNVSVMLMLIWLIWKQNLSKLKIVASN